MVYTPACLLLVCPSHACLVPFLLHVSYILYAFLAGMPLTCFYSMPVWLYACILYTPICYTHNICIAVLCLSAHFYAFGRDSLVLWTGLEQDRELWGKKRRGNGFTFFPLHFCFVSLCIVELLINSHSHCSSFLFWFYVFCFPMFLCFLSLYAPF